MDRSESWIKPWMPKQPTYSKPVLQGIVMAVIFGVVTFVAFFFPDHMAAVGPQRWYFKLAFCIAVYQVFFFFPAALAIAYLSRCYFRETYDRNYSLARAKRRTTPEEWWWTAHVLAIACSVIHFLVTSAPDDNVLDGRPWYVRLAMFGVTYEILFALMGWVAATRAKRKIEQENPWR